MQVFFTIGMCFQKHISAFLIIDIKNIEDLVNSFYLY